MPEESLMAGLCTGGRGGVLRMRPYNWQGMHFLEENRTHGCASASPERQQYESSHRIQEIGNVQKESFKLKKNKNKKPTKHKQAVPKHS